TSTTTTSNANTQRSNTSNPLNSNNSTTHQNKRTTCPQKRHHLSAAVCHPVAQRRTATMKTKSGTNEGTAEDSPSQLIDARIEELNDWRGEMLARVRKVIRQADPDVVEEVKWRKPSNSMLGVPVWSHAGILCTGETYKNVVKLTFAKGAALADPSGLFNASLEGNTRRAIDFHEGDKIDEKTLQALIRAAVALNSAIQKKPKIARGAS
ncbi:MAG: DUF1801 domain-containing protein, partial [Planctomycetaceae bacterium]